MSRTSGAEEPEESAYEFEVIVDNVKEAVSSSSNDPFHDLQKLHNVDGIGKGLKRQITNNLEKAANRRDKNKPGSQAIDTDPVTGYDVLQVVSPPYNPHVLVKLLDRSSVHYSAVQAKVANVVGLGYSLVESNKAKQKAERKSGEELASFRRKMDRLKDGVHEWLDGCNDLDLFIETLKKAYMDYETIGWGCIEIGRTKDGRIGYIGHIAAKTIRIRRERDGFVQISSNKARFFRNFGDQETANPLKGQGGEPINEIIMLKKYHPSNTYYGVPDICAAQEAVAGNKFAGSYNLDYFENKAVPRYLVIVKGGTLNSQQQRKIFEFFNTKLKGQNHRSLIVPMPADKNDSKTSFEIKAIESGLQEASFKEYRKTNNEEILMAHRVPAHKTGNALGTNVALAKELSRVFSEEVCDPERKVLEQRLNKLLAQDTDAFYIKLNVGSLVDELTQSTIDVNNSKIGTRTPDELRARDGLNGIPGGNKTMLDKQEAAKASQKKADDKANTQQNRERDQRRQESATSNEIAGRNSKGAGPQSD